MKLDNELTVKQKKYLMEWVSCQDKVEAYKNVYKPKHNDEDKIANAARQIHYQIMRKPAAAELITEVYPKDEFAVKLSNMIEAKKDNVYNGQVISQSPDNTTQMQALNLYANVTGVTQKQRNIEVTMTDKRQTLIVNMPSPEIIKAPDRPVKDVETEFIEEYEKNQED